MKKHTLRLLIKESIREVIRDEKQLFEQTTAECQQIYNLPLQNNLSFGGCCEMTGGWQNYSGNPPTNPSDPNDSCKGLAVAAYNINSNYTACCDPNYTGGGTRGDCNDPLWVGMPSPNKMEYCNRCKESGGGVATAGNYPVQLSAGSPYYMNDPSGLSYCHCCDDGSSGMDCDNPEWVAQNPGAARKCFICQQAPAPCEQISNIPGMTVAIAQGLNLTLYNDVASCNSSTECGPGTGGSRCEQMTVGVYDPSGNNPQHNENWGMGCWFCHPEPNHPDFPGCTNIIGGMTQVNAYAAFTAGTSNIYPTPALCEADPITKCGDEDPGDKIYCECCDGNSPGNAISMAQTVGSAADCMGAENTVYAGLGVYGCNVSPVSGGPGTNCKKPGTGTPTNPNVYAKVKPGSEKPDRRLREASNYINKILKQ